LNFRSSSKPFRAAAPFPPRLWVGLFMSAGLAPLVNLPVAAGLKRSWTTCTAAGHGCVSSLANLVLWMCCRHVVQPVKQC
jgi:hypothetical protein